MEELAKEITKKTDTTEAIKKFKELADAPELYFNDGPFPESESNSEAKRKCSSEKSRYYWVSFRY